MKLPHSPASLGLPFNSWRQSQTEGVEYMLSGDEWVSVLCQPTGAGKSILGPAAAKFSHKKTVILTATRGLQDQYSATFERAGLIDIRGADNYQCVGPGAKPWHTCAHGKAEGCALHGSGFCEYQKAVCRVYAAELVCTNYQYWIRSNEAGARTFVGTKLLVCDEAHAAFHELARALSVRLSWTEAVAMAKKKLTPGGKLGEWREWAAQRKKEVARDLRDEDDVFERERLLDLSRKLGRVARMQDDQWVWEIDQNGAGVTFECVWPGIYRSALFGEPNDMKIAMVSATVRPYTLQLLGIGKKDFKFREWPRVFPANRAPVIHVPTVAVKWDSEECTLPVTVARIDEIISSRLDRKGIVHTKSYKRAADTRGLSEHSSIMLVNSGGHSSKNVVDLFRRTDPPCVLVSPSFATGYDFPMDQCEYQIISKMPFEYSASQVGKQRGKDRRYRLYSVVQEFVQACGRGMRGMLDRCETFIIDDQCVWVLWHGRMYAPSYFQMRTALDVPPPPEKL